jgi:hypothetical protein
MTLVDLGGHPVWLLFEGVDEALVAAGTPEAPANRSRPTTTG